MSKKQKFYLILFLLIDACLLLFSLALIFRPELNWHWAQLDPKGLVAEQQRGAMIKATLLMLIAVVPVYVLTFTIAYRYRAGNAAAAYTPEQNWNPYLQTAIILLPVCVVAAIAALTWKTAHQLDPYRPLPSSVPPLTVQVVALDWKWLFIYPEQNIATVNFVEFPAGTPINFELTADAPMNSFWIPQLGGQIYAMAGMSTQLHLMADQPGVFRGQPGEINGRGFSGMQFAAKAVPAGEFAAWVASVRQTSPELNSEGYHQLAAPSTDSPEASYGRVTANLYNTIINKYLSPMPATGAGQGTHN